MKILFLHKLKKKKKINNGSISANETDDINNENIIKSPKEEEMKSLSDNLIKSKEENENDNI